MVLEGGAGGVEGAAGVWTPSRANRPAPRASRPGRPPTRPRCSSSSTASLSMPAGAHPIIGVIWADPLQRFPDVVMPPRSIGATPSGPSYDDLTIQIFRPPPPAAVVDISAAGGVRAAAGAGGDRRRRRGRRRNISRCRAARADPAAGRVSGRHRPGADLPAAAASSGIAERSRGLGGRDRIPAGQLSVRRTAVPGTDRAGQGQLSFAKIPIPARDSRLHAQPFALNHSRPLGTSIWAAAESIREPRLLAVPSR